MNIAGKQIQCENVDLNNLWHWPTESWQGGAVYTTSVFTPEIMKWTRFADGPKIVGSPSSSYLTFTENSATSRYYQGYFGSIFLDVKPGTYVISFDVNNRGQTGIYSFLNLGQGYCYDKAQPGFKWTDPGHYEYQFECLNNSICLWVFNDSGSGNWVTLTNIKIREGVI